jgi:hypothetical protein
MSTLTGPEIAKIITDSGWFKTTDVTEVDTLTAIALAESHGDTNAISPTHDYGLWQINKASHPDLFLLYRWQDPAQNVLMARKVYENAGHSLKPWATFNSGAYRNYLGQSRHVLAGNTPVAPDGAISSAIHGTQDTVSRISGITAGALSDVMKFLSASFLTIGAALLSGLLLILGVWFLVKNTKTYAAAKDTAGDVAKTAAVAAAV